MARAVAAPLLLLFLVAGGSMGDVRPAEGGQGVQEDGCASWFRDQKDAFGSCKASLVDASQIQATVCPQRCKGLLDGMPSPCWRFVTAVVPQELQSQSPDEQYDLCQSLKCNSAGGDCRITFEVLPVLQPLFLLPDPTSSVWVSSLAGRAGDTSGSEGDTDLPVGAIVGGVVAANVLVLAAVALFVILRRRRRRRLQQLEGVQGQGSSDVELAAAWKGRASGDIDSASPEAKQRAAGVGVSAVAASPALPPSPFDAPSGRASPEDAAGGAHLAALWGGAAEAAAADAALQQGLAEGTRPSSLAGDPLLEWVNSQQASQQTGSGVSSGALVQKPSGDSSRATSMPPQPSGGSSRGAVTPQHQSASSSAASSAVTLPPGQPGSSRVLSQRRSSAVVDLAQWEVEYEDLKIVRPLGEGSYGKVYLATLNETLVALKLLVSADQPALNSEESGSWLSPGSPVMQALHKECVLMASLRHPHVVLFLGVCYSPPAVITEFCSRGSLHDVLRGAQAQQGLAASLTWPRRLNLALDAAKGMLALHAHSPPIIHRDLKSPNLLCDSAWRVKICDFNLSRLMEETGARSSSMGGMLNPRWLAPEVLAGGSASTASDVFSFGVVLWELLTWCLPWEGRNAFQLVHAVSSGERLPVPPREEVAGAPPPPAVYDGYIALMQRCWAQDPAERPPFADVIVDLRRILALTIAASSARALTSPAVDP